MHLLIHQFERAHDPGLAGQLVERLQHLTLLIMAATAIALFASADVGAQTSCQPTIMQPCTPPPDNTANQSKPTVSDKRDQPARASRRGLQVAPDTTFGLSGRSLGLQRQF
jgi:hypothetical protein